MTAIFALLAACGAAGVAWSLLGQGRGPGGPSFKEVLREADGPGQDFERRLELLEEKIMLLESGAAPVAPARFRVEAHEDYLEPAPRSQPPLIWPQGAAARGRQAEAGSLSGRMRAVWEASDRNKSPLEIARALKMGVAEVELALKVKNIRPEWG